MVTAAADRHARRAFIQILDTVVFILTCWVISFVESLLLPCSVVGVCFKVLMLVIPVSAVKDAAATAAQARLNAILKLNI